MAPTASRPAASPPHKKVRLPNGTKAAQNKAPNAALRTATPAHPSRSSANTKSTSSNKRRHSQRADSADEEEDGPRSDAGDDIDDEEMAKIALDQLTSHTAEEHPLYAVGKSFGRTVDMFKDFDQIMTAGQLAIQAVSDDSEDDTDDEAEDEKEAEKNECKRLLGILKDEIPGLTQRILACEMAAISKELRVSRNNARSTDLNSIKGRITSDYLQIPHLDSSDKSKRGRFNEQTARLLSPADADFNNDEEQRQKILRGEFQFNPNDWPLFLYANFEADPEDLSKGAFESELLFQVWRCIFFGPSKANLSKSSASRPSRRSNATLHNMLETVKPASIAYVATLIRHSLSAEEDFHPDGHTNGFDYCDFYYGIRDFLEGKLEGAEEKAKEIRELWDRTVFPKRAAARNRKGNDSCVKNKLLQQLKKKRSALGDTTNM